MISATHTLYVTFIRLKTTLKSLVHNDEYSSLPEPLYTHASLFFKQGGRQLTFLSISTLSELDTITLDESINLICCPSLRDLSKPEFGKKLAALYTFSEKHHAMLILDTPSFLRDTEQLKQWFLKSSVIKHRTGSFYYPDLHYKNETIPTSIIVAALYEHNDRIYGLLRCPSGATLPLLPELTPSQKLTNEETLALNWIGLNCVRSFSSIGSVLWGRKTALGHDDKDSQWKYVFVVRIVQFISKIALKYSKEITNSPDASITKINHPKINAMFNDFYQKGFFLGDSMEESVLLNRVRKKNKSTLYIGAKLLHKDQFIEWSLGESL